MADRIDHAAEARRLLRESDEAVEAVRGLGDDFPGIEALASAVDRGLQNAAKQAQVHATLALVEQQRVGNIIALSQALDGNGWQAAAPLEALFGYRREAGGMEDGGLHIRPDVAAALGIEVLNG